MSKARSLADLGNVYDDGALSHRNLIINGAMQVAQRATSVTGIGQSTTFPTCDRVKFYNQGGAGPTYTVTQATDAPEGFKYSWKIETTTADSSLPAAHYSLLRLGMLEYNDTRRLQYNTASAKKATLSFWVKSSIAGDQDFLLTAHGSIQRHHGQTLTINSTNTWEYKTFVFDADTDTTNTPDSETDVNQHLSIDFRITAGTNFQGGTLNSTWGSRASNQYANNCLQIGSTSNATFQITGVQFEVGDTATPFEHIPYTDQLARCRRYYYEPNSLTNGNRFAIYQGYITNGNSYNHTFFLPVEMRAIPTYTATMGSAVNFSSSITAGDLSDQSGRVYATANGNDANGYFYYTITADAEL